MAVSIANLPGLLSNSIDGAASLELIRDAVEQWLGGVAPPLPGHFDDLPSECEAIASMIRRSMSNPVIRGQIIEELSTALQQLGADRVLLAIVGSIGANMSDQEVLIMLRGWNGGEQLVPIPEKSQPAGDNTLGHCRRTEPARDTEGTRPHCSVGDAGR